VLTMCYDF